MFQNEDEFLAAVEAIEADLAVRNIDVAWRPFFAQSELDDRLGSDLPFPPPNRDPVSGVYSGEDLVIRLHRWYRKRYGDRLDEYMGPGRVAFELRGVVWAFRLPGFIVGSQLVVHCGEPDQLIPAGTDADDVDVIDVLDVVEGRPENLGEGLTDNDRKRLVATFLLGYEALELLAQHDIPMVRQALADNDGAVHYLTAPTPNFGLAKWSSLQATEKALKAFSQLSTGKHRSGHILIRLASEAEAAGLSDATRDYLPLIQCDASVRYGDLPVTRVDALAAHHAALHVVSIIGRALRKRQTAA